MDLLIYLRWGNDFDVGAFWIFMALSGSKKFCARVCELVGTSPSDYHLLVGTANAVQAPSLEVMLQNLPAAKDQEAPLVESCVQIHANVYAPKEEAE